MVAFVPRPSLPRRWQVRAGLVLACLLGFSIAPRPAGAETVIERAARTGVITMGGRTDVSPYSFLGTDRRPVGYALDVGNLIGQEVSRYLGKPVRVAFVPGDDPSRLFNQVSRGEIDLACGAQFTWEREMFVDFSIPFSLSGIRILTRTGSFDGTPGSLAGRRIAAVPGSLGEATLKAVQPRAVPVAVSDLRQGIQQLAGGNVAGVIGDSIILAATVRQESRQGLELVPAQGYARYAMGCILPENNSTFRNLVNLAIAQMIQGYLDGRPESTALVNRWLGEEGILGLPSELIRAYFQAVLLNHEGIRVPAATSTSPAPAATR